MKIGILGGAFNPIHFGHLRIAEEVREKLDLKKVLLIPSGNPPLKSRDLADAHHRLEMTRLAVETGPFFDVSDIECRKSGKSYTVESLAKLSELFPEKELYFILGIDSFLDMPSWHQPERLSKLAHFVVVSRPGRRFMDLSPMIPQDLRILSELDSGKLEINRSPQRGGKDLLLLNVTRIGISATVIRGLVRKGMSIKYLLPETVESYIIANKLFLEGSGHP